MRCILKLIKEEEQKKRRLFLIRVRFPIFTYPVKSIIITLVTSITAPDSSLSWESFGTYQNGLFQTCNLESPKQDAGKVAFRCSTHFFDTSKACFTANSKLALRAQTLNLRQFRIAKMCVTEKI